MREKIKHIIKKIETGANYKKLIVQTVKENANYSGKQLKAGTKIKYVTQAVFHEPEQQAHVYIKK